MSPLPEELAVPAAKKPTYKPLYAVLAAGLLVGVLLMPVDAFQADGVSFIDTELKSRDPDGRTYVTTKYPIGDSAKLAQFPKSLGKWNATHQYAWDFLAELLDTDVLLARDYRAPGVYIPVTLLILQSTNMSSFHPAPICYRAQGYTILEEHTSAVNVPVRNTSWASPAVLQGDERHFKGSIDAKRLVVERNSRDGATQRELNLYFYIKEESGHVTKKIAWIRISMFVPATGSYEAHEKLLADFMGEVVPELFVPVAGEPSETVLERLIRKVM